MARPEEPRLGPADYSVERLNHIFEEFKRLAGPEWAHVLLELMWSAMDAGDIEFGIYTELHHPSGDLEHEQEMIYHKQLPSECGPEGGRLPFQPLETPTLPGYDRMGIGMEVEVAPKHKEWDYAEEL